MSSANIANFLLSMPWPQFYTVRKLIFDYAVCNLKQAMARERCHKFRNELFRTRRRHLRDRDALVKGCKLRKQNIRWMNRYVFVGLARRFDRNFEGKCFTFSPSSKRICPTIVNYPPTGKYSKLLNAKMSMRMTLPVRYFIDQYVPDYN